MFSHQRIFNSTSWYLLEKLARLVGAFLIGAWVARHLGPADYGTLAFALALVATLGFLGSLGIESLVIRDLVRSPHRQQEIISTYFFLRLFGSIFVPLLATVYLRFLGSDDLELLLLVLLGSISIFIGATDVTDCVLQAKQSSKTTSLIRLTGFLVGAAFKCCLVLASAGVIWFAVAGLVEAAIIGWLYLRSLRSLGLTLSPSRWSKAEARNWLVDGRSMVLSGLAVVVYSKLDVLAIGSLLSKEALGPYAIAASMGAAWNMVGMSLVQAWAPHVSAALSRGQGAYISNMRRLLVAAATLSIVGSAILSWLSPWLFSVLLGDAYAQGAAVFSVLVWSSVPVFLGVATSQIIVNERIYWVSLARTALGMLVSLAFIAPMASTWGVVGVAALVVISAWAATAGILLSESARTTISTIFSSSRKTRHEH